MNATPTAPTPRPCACGYHCKTCQQHYRPAEVLGWDAKFCSPRCEEIARKKAADAFAAWWNRPRA